MIKKCIIELEFSQFFRLNLRADSDVCFFLLWWKPEKRNKSLTFFAFFVFYSYNLEENLFVEFVPYAKEKKVRKKTPSFDKT